MSLRWQLNREHVSKGKVTLQRLWSISGKAAAEAARQVTLTGV